MHAIFARVEFFNSRKIILLTGAKAYVTRHECKADPRNVEIRDDNENQSFGAAKYERFGIS